MYNQNGQEVFVKLFNSLITSYTLLFSYIVKVTLLCRSGVQGLLQKGEQRQLLYDSAV